MSWRSSVRMRLFVGGAVLITAAVAAAGVTLAALFRHHLDAQYHAELVHQLDSLTASVSVDGSGRPALRTQPADPRFHEAYGGRYWQIETPGGRPLRSRSLWDQTLNLPADLPPAGELHRHEVDVPGLGRLRVVERVTRFSDRPEVPVRIAVALPVSEVASVVGRFERLLWITLAALAAGLLMASAIQVTVGLAPLAALERALSRIRSGSARRMEGGFPLEVAGVVDELNGLLAERERSVERARAQAADLAHALKTPLQLLLLDAERLQAELPDRAAEIREHAHRMQAATERQLARARMQAHSRTGRSMVDLATCVQAVARALAPVAAARGLAINSKVSTGLSCSCERADLEEILGNLIENACKWARSRVRVSGELQNSMIRVTVEDDGPGLADADRTRALARGQRLDEAVPGSGLGLAIARDVAEGNGGWLQLERSDMGGLAAQIHLPMAAARIRSA